jgi:hypothetical protein
MYRGNGRDRSDRTHRRNGTDGTCWGNWTDRTDGIHRRNGRDRRDGTYWMYR